MLSNKRLPLLKL